MDQDSCRALKMTSLVHPRQRGIRRQINTGGIQVGPAQDQVLAWFPESCKLETQSNIALSLISSSNTRPCIGNIILKNKIVQLFAKLFVDNMQCISWLFLGVFVLFCFLKSLTGCVRLPWWLSGKESTCNAGATGIAGLIPEVGRSLQGGYSNLLQYSCLENPMDRGAWQATVHGVTKSQTWLKWLSMHACTSCISKRRNEKMCWNSRGWKDLQAEGIQLSLPASRWQKWQGWKKKDKGQQRLKLLIDSRTVIRSEERGVPGSLRRTFCEVWWIKLHVMDILWITLEFMNIPWITLDLEISCSPENEPEIPTIFCKKNKVSLITTWGLTPSHCSPVPKHGLKKTRRPCGYCWLHSISTKGQVQVKHLGLGVDIM